MDEKELKALAEDWKKASDDLKKANEGKLDLVLRFREIEIVDTQTVSGLVVKPPSSSQKSPEAKDTKPDGAKKAEKPAQQSSAPKNKGKTQPQAAPKKSVLAGVFG